MCPRVTSARIHATYPATDPACRLGFRRLPGVRHKAKLALRRCGKISELDKLEQCSATVTLRRSQTWQGLSAAHLASFWAWRWKGLSQKVRSDDSISLLLPRGMRGILSLSSSPRLKGLVRPPGHQGPPVCYGLLEGSESR